MLNIKILLIYAIFTTNSLINDYSHFRQFEWIYNLKHLPIKVEEYKPALSLIYFQISAQLFK